jgi:SAM-dependent methyltransferase
MLRRVFDSVIRPVYVTLRGLVDQALERRAGIRTRGLLHLDELGFSNQHLGYYKPAGWFQLRRILRRREVSRDDVFLDIGSGMGRVVYQAAAWYPFRRVIGLELSERLNVIARDNIRRARSRLRCQDVEIISSDVLDYELPDDVTVVYLNNPFTGPVFEAVVAKLVESLRRRPRTLRVVYANPKEEAMLLRGGFRHVRTLRGMRPTPEWSRSNSVRMYMAGVAA